MKKSFFLPVLMMTFFMVIQGQQSLATNIQVDDIVIVERNDAEEYIIVEFDLSWDNSFRVDDGANTNWDAAWVFMKYKKTTETNVQWGHATLHGSGHEIPGNFNGDLGATNGTNKGMFVYPSVIFNGTATIEDMRMRWDYGQDGLTPEDEVDIRVFGIEMVYVPQGSFYVGSGGTENNHFYAGGGAQDEPFEITDAAFMIENTSGNLWATGDIGGGDGTLPSGFPTGYGDFYMMKHEITQQAYVDFLNTLNYSQQDARTDGSPGSTGYIVPDGNSDQDRYKINVATAGSSGSSPAVYATDNKWVACARLSKKDMMSYLDWAALRPMTELEYEKAARGPSNPVPNEFAWGNTRAGSVTEVSDPGLATEAAVPSGYQRDITIDHNKVDSDLEDFPILVKLDSSNFDFSKCQPDGDDIRFYDAAGTELKYQRERHDEPNEKAEYWVKVPHVSSSENTVITMEYGDPGASDGEDVPNVWNDGYFTSIWHLKEEGTGSAGEYADAAGSNGGQATGSYPSRLEGPLGFGQDFAGDAAITVPDDASLGIENKVTVSGWLKPRALSGASDGDTTASDWNDNQSMTNLTVEGDSLLVSDHTSPGTRIAKPISLDAIKKAGSSHVSWSDHDGYKVRAFTTDGVFTVPEGVSEVDVLVVGGGGGGGASPHGGGGGAGGVVYESDYSVTAGQTISVSVGAGGNGPTGPTSSPWQDSETSLRGRNGENSSFGSLVALGGGGGGRHEGLAGKDGGSGGGAGCYDASGGNAQQPGSASGGYGSDGGSNSGGSGAGGGGGANGVGADGTGSAGGDGGAGRYYGDIFGDSYGDNGYFAGGGGGSMYGGSNAGSGGNGGGGAGGDTDSQAQDAQANTGGGGGGAERYNSGDAGDGGSGIVLVRYKDPQSVKVYTKVTSDNSTPPTFKGQQVFTSDSTFTVPEGVHKVDVLVVGGGGAGSGGTSGGGGAGGLVWKTGHGVTPGDNISVTVGAGGSGGATASPGTNGENSSFGSIVAQGGGHGASGQSGGGTAAGDGGSGGGAMQYENVYRSFGTGTSGEGYNGGDVTGDKDATAGGGGAGGVGSSVTSGAGDGGIGRDFSHIFGTGVGDNGWFAGGGGGGWEASDVGQGGRGGGGDGINGGDAPTSDNHGMPNTGGGGGGAWNYNTGSGADGGSGVVIVRWGNYVDNGSSVPGIEKGDDLSGKYLWVMQELNTNNPNYSPSLNNLEVEVKGEAIVAGKGEDAYQLGAYDGQLKGYLNNQEVSSSLTMDEYQHVAITYDGSFQKIYINGLLTATSTLTGSITNNSSDLLMGTNLEGALDEVRVSDTSRTQAWLKAEYHSGNGDLVNIGGEGTLSNATYGNADLTGVGDQGPMRVGFAASSSSSRTAAGASYWGIMDLSGNLWERAITVGNADGLAFTGNHGDGLLDASGLFDVSNWNINGYGFRGGQYASGIQYLRISDRNFMNHTTESRSKSWGGRGVRTAPE